MITALVQFKLPQPITIERAREVFSGTASKYREITGLIRKYYVLSVDGGTAGGVYLWKSREDAERLYTEDWKNFIQDKYGAEPSVTYFDTPVVVDNAIGTIITDEWAVCKHGISHCIKVRRVWRRTLYSSGLAVNSRGRPNNWDARSQRTVFFGRPSCLRS